MRRPKPAFLLALILAGAVALVSSHGADAPPPKKRVVKPAASPAKPAPASRAAPVRPATSKPADATQATGPAATPAKSSTAKNDPGAPATNGAAANASENKPVDLEKNDNKSINFTSGKPVVTDSAEDKVAIRAALKDFAEASKGVTFGPSKKKPAPAPATPRN